MIFLFIPGTTKERSWDFSVTGYCPAILDHLLHHCRVINIKGHSYRLKGHSFSKQIFNEQEQKQQVKKQNL